MDAQQRLLLESSWEALEHAGRTPLTGEGLSIKWTNRKLLNHLKQTGRCFYGLAQPEAAAMDAQQRLLLESSWEALEHAGRTPLTGKSCQNKQFVQVIGASQCTAALVWRSKQSGILEAWQHLHGVTLGSSGATWPYRVHMQ